MQEAIDKGATQDIVTGEGIWVVSGKNCRYELELDPAYLEAKFKNVGADGRVTVPFSTEKFLSDSKLQLSYDVVLALATVSPPASRSGPSLVPTVMAGMSLDEKRNPSTMINDALQKGRCKLRPPDNQIDREIAVVEIRTPAKETGNVDGLAVYRFDASRGYSLVGVELGADGKPPAQMTVVTSLQKCSNGSWFPQRSVQIDPSNGANSVVSVREIIVAELITDRKPNENDLTIALPKGTAINDGKTPGSQFVVDNDLKLFPSRLGAISQMTVDAAKKYAQGEKKGAKSAKGKIKKGETKDEN
jgi:hypothetical protein